MKLTTCFCPKWQIPCSLMHWRLYEPVHRQAWHCPPKPEYSVLSIRRVNIKPTEWTMKSIQTWWRHQMETFSALLAICAGNSPVPDEFPHKGQWRGALMFSLICVWINGWVNNPDAGDLRRYRTHYDVSVMSQSKVNEVRLRAWFLWSEMRLIRLTCGPIY